jgi:hypothetical protein
MERGEWMEKEPETDEEFNAAKIRPGDDLIDFMNKKNDEITLVRVRKLSDLDYRPDDENAEEDFELYERTESKYFRRIFFKTMNDSKRVFIDHMSDHENPFDMENEFTKYDEWYEKHDDKYTQYLDYDDVEWFLKEHKVYQEVK